MNYGFYKPSLFSFLKKFNYTSFLNNTSKTIGVIKDIIPVYYQVKPLINNCKTMFKVFSIVNTNDNKANNNNNINKMVSKNVIHSNANNTNNPVFFIN